MSVGRATVATTPGASLIAIERNRQISREGWTLEHDDDHGAGGVLLDAARCYELAAAFQLAPPSITQARFVERPAVWPWDESSWKPSTDPVRNLVKAGALIAAEIDRLLRVAEAAAATDAFEITVERPVPLVEDTAPGQPAAAVNPLLAGRVKVVEP